MSGGGWRQARRPASLGLDLVSAPDPTMEGSRAGECGRPCQLGLASAAPRPCPGWAGRHSCHLVAEDPGASYITLEKEGFHAQFTDKGVEATNTTSLVKILQCVLIVLRLGPSLRSRHYPHSCHTEVFTISPLTGHPLVSSPVPRVSLHCVGPPLIPTSSCLCGNATSSRKPPLIGSSHRGNSH